jgi:hypothetical protein
VLEVLIEPVEPDKSTEIEVGLSTKFGGSAVEAGPAVSVLLLNSEVVGIASVAEDPSSPVEVGTGATISVVALEEDSLAETSTLAELEAVSVAVASLV